VWDSPQAPFGEARAINKKSFISNRHHSFNSFVPNIVCLPRQIAKLTDQDGSIAQSVLQTLSHHIYHDVEMPSEIESLWKRLPCPGKYIDLQLQIENVIFFRVNENWSSS